MWDNVRPWWAARHNDADDADADDDADDIDDKPIRLQSHIIVSGDDALAMTIVEELNNAGVSIIKLSARRPHRR